MKKILFPTDFSESAANAFQYALEVARLINGKIDLLCVYHLPVADASSVPPEYIDRMLKERKKEVMEELQQFIGDAPRELIGSRRADYGIFVSTEITEAAGDDGYDLIIMGTKGHHNAMEKLMGSVTTQTLMHAPCPVIAVPEQARFEKIDHIAYATDFYPEDEPAVSQLMELAGIMGARVHFVHIDTSGKAEKNTIELSTRYGDFADFNVLSNSSIMEGIDQFAQDKGVDLLALFIPRRRLLERLFHSSFTKKMALHTKLPLLVFRA